MSQKKNSSRSRSSYSSDKRDLHIALWPLIFVTAVIPLLVRINAYTSYLTDYDAFGTASIEFDFFLHVKASALIAVSSVMAVIALYRLVVEGRKIKFSKAFIPLGAYALLAVLSSLVSEYKPFPTKGVFEQFETIYVLLGYCIIAYYAFLCINSDNDLKIVLIALSAGTVLLLLLGISQGFATDFFSTAFGKRLVLGSEYYQQVKADPSKLTFEFEKGRTYLTFYNPNYVGSYTSLLCPLFLMMVFMAEKLWQKVLFGVIDIGLIVVLLRSQSRAGFVGIIAGILLLAVIFNSRLITNWFPTALIAIILIGTVYTVNNYSNNALVNKVKSAFSVTDTVYNLTRIDTFDDHVEFDYKGNTLKVSGLIVPEKGFFEVYASDASGAAIPCEVRVDNGVTYYAILDDRFSGIKVAAGQYAIMAKTTLQDYLTINGLDYPAGVTAVDLTAKDWYQYTVWGIQTVIDGHEWDFVQTDEGYRYRTCYGKVLDLTGRSSETWEWLESHGHFASGRGFIWARTIPLLKDNILLGSGADTFALEFPNDDFLSLYNAGYDSQIVTKPHNQYLQTAVQTGVLSLVALLAFYCMYFFTSLKLYITRRRYTFCSYAGIGILCGSFGYMVVQLINDSTVAVAPLYWAFIGMGFAVNMIVKNTPDEGVMPMAKEKQD